MSGSQVGTAQTGAGPESSPFFLSGKVYLTASSETTFENDR